MLISTFFILSYFFVITIQQSITPLVYHYETVQKDETKTFVLESTCSNCNYYELKFAMSPVSSPIKFYIEHTFEIYKETPLYQNSTEISIKSVDDEYGYNRIILEVNNPDSNKIMVHSKLLPLKGYVLTDEDKAYFMMKYKTEQKVDDFIRLTFDPKVTYSILRRRGTLNLTLISRQMLNVDIFSYTFLYYNKTDSENYHTVYLNKTDTYIKKEKKELTQSGDQKSFDFILPKDKYTNAVANVILFFINKGSNEEIYLSYDSIVLAYQAPKLNYLTKNNYLDTTQAICDTNVFGLKKTSSNDRYFIIDISFMPQLKKTITHGYTFEADVNSLTFYKNSFQIKRVDTSKGRRRYVIDNKNTNEIILTIFNDKESMEEEFKDNSGFSIKFYTTDNYENQPNIVIDNTIEATQIFKEYNFTFKEINTPSLPSYGTYHCRIYNMDKYEEINELNTIYLTDMETEKEIDFYGNNTNLSFTFEDRRDTYIPNLVLVIIGELILFIDGEHIKERIAYEVTVFEHKNKSIPLLQPLIYNELSLSQEAPTSSFRIKKQFEPYSSYPYYQVEIAKAPYNDYSDNTDIIFSLEGYREVPKIQNDTELEIVNSSFVDGKHTYFIYLKDPQAEDFILSFSLNSSSNINGPYDYLIKYKSLENLSNITQYSFKHDLSASSGLGYIKINFEEIFKDKNTVSLSEYYAAVYNDTFYSEMNDNIMNIKSNKDTVEVFKIIGDHKGTEYGTIFSLPSNRSSGLFVNLVAVFKSANGEENRISYGMARVESYNTLLILIILGVLVVILVCTSIIVFFIYKKKKGGEEPPLPIIIKNNGLVYPVLDEAPDVDENFEKPTAGA